MMLQDHQIQDFIQDGFVKIENAFSSQIAKQACDILWSLTGCVPNDPDTWKVPVIRIGELTDPCFIKAAHSPILIQAYDQLVGKNNWLPKTSVGSFPIRFPSKIDANDTGWHVDASYPGENPADYMQWKINVQSKARGLLMLFLFSDVGVEDAPTLLKRSSHKEVANILAPFKEEGIPFMELAAKLNNLGDADIIEATGKAGTVYLCHPFMVHAAQNHKGIHPKFMAQPALMTKRDFTLHQDEVTMCPVEVAIFRALQ